MIPQGFIYIVWPSFGKSVDLDRLYMEEFQKNIESKPDSRLLWIDVFPFAQKNALDTLNGLRSRLMPLDITVGMLRSERRYAYSDVSGEEAAIEQAIKEWSNLGIKESVIIESGEHRSLFKSLLSQKRSYIPALQSRIRHDVHAKFKLYRKYFDEDYHWIILSELTADYLDPVFSYEAWCQESSPLVAGWNKQVRKRIIPGLNEKLAEFVKMKVDETEVYDLNAFLQPRLSEVWETGFRYIEESIEDEDFPKGTVSEIQYMAAIKTYKSQFIEAFTHVTQVLLRNTVKEVIEKHFGLWGRLA
ncbi:hypothetical protein [Paenibacillus sp. JJ-223]|uniref:hypothetical protein n=1 Tax=Paenibacillus sp. JJ-223 TaxID=2905647 RepID=UPI001F470FEF|nr:hypothetical protein [Paenibacillus sp. JJ-223]